jgi:EXS family
VCNLDDNSSTNKHDSIPVPLLPWRSSSSCLTTCIFLFDNFLKYTFRISNLIISYCFYFLNFFAFQVMLYVVALTLLIFPFDIFYLSSRYFLLRTIWRICLPLQAISLFLSLSVLSEISPISSCPKNCKFFSFVSSCHDLSDKIGQKSVLIKIFCSLLYYCNS